MSAKPIVPRELANRDIESAIDYYLSENAEQAALGFIDALEKAYTHISRHPATGSTFIIWAKNTFTLGRADYQRQYEPILYGWPEGGQRHWCGDRDQGDVWQINKPAKNDLHPTMKPVELVERAIRNSSKPGQVVLDPFGGSGTTLIAAEKTGRVARLIELDPKYVDVIVRRWQDWTGQQANRRRWRGGCYLASRSAYPDFCPAQDFHCLDTNDCRGQRH